MKRLFFSLFVLAVAFVANTQAQVLPDNLPTDRGVLKNLKTTIVGSYPQQVDWYSWTGSAWQADKVEKITYNQLGDYLTITMDYQEGVDHKTTYTYNNFRYPTIILEQDFIGGNWVDVERSRIEFDAFNNATLYVSEKYVAGKWEIEDGMLIENEVQAGKLTKSTYSVWMPDTKTYNLATRTFYSYGSNGLISTYYSEEYKDEVWTKTSRVTLTYTNDLDEESMLYESWENEAWVPFMKTTYEYGQNDSQTSITHAWDEETSAFVPMMRDISQYDSHGNLILQTSEFWMGFDWFMMSGRQYDITYQGDNVTQQITKEWQGTEYVNSTKEVFSGFLNLGIDDPGSLGLLIHVFPNPANSTLTIQYPLYGTNPPSFQLVDVTGRPVMSETPKWGAKQLDWDISNIPNGVYFVRMIQDNGKVLIEKILKQ